MNVSYPACNIGKQTMYTVVEARKRQTEILQ